ncbi:MAG TPA: sigma-70 family RNA polymerase sigma factor [Chitinophagaceae bacterium]|nr:sigma-70 family RNA polymerase sigma factor [Chitinophagaceae bacterium]
MQQRNQQAFTYLYDHYSGALFGIIQQIVPESHSAGDVLQEVFVNIWRKIDSYDPSRGRLFTWMLNIARNAAIDKVRSRAYRQERKSQAIPEDIQEWPDQAVRPATDDYGLRKLLGKLRQEQRVLIELSYFQGFTHEEIARTLDIPLGTVKTRIRSALIQLRSMM